MKFTALVSILFLWASAALAQAPPPAVASDVEGVSLLGKELKRPALAAENAAIHEAAIVELQAHLRRHPADAEGMIWLGRRVAYLGRYREAIEIFGDGARRHPEDARFLRHRGHRFLTLRRVDDAIADFERGLALVAGKPDEIEADGLPNLFNQPTSTLKTNLWYHLGLGYYLKADFGRAAAAFQACAALSDNADMWVAATYWQVLATHHAGRAAEAKAMLAALPNKVETIENEDYWRLLQLFAGRLEAGKLQSGEGGVPGATLGYGLGAWHYLAGRDREAREAFEKVTKGDTWAAFGYLAAEGELARVRVAP